MILDHRTGGSLHGDRVGLLINRNGKIALADLRIEATELCARRLQSRSCLYQVPAYRAWIRKMKKAGVGSVA